MFRKESKSRFLIHRGNQINNLEPRCAMIANPNDQAVGGARRKGGGKRERKVRIDSRIPNKFV